MPDSESIPDPASEPETKDGDCAQVAETAEQIAEDIAAVIDLDTQDRLLLKTLEPVMGELRQCTCADESPRVRFAADMALIAICDRVRRIMGRDLPADKV